MTKQCRLGQQGARGRFGLYRVNLNNKMVFEILGVCVNASLNIWICEYVNVCVNKITSKYYPMKYGYVCLDRVYIDCVGSTWSLSNCVE